MDISNYKFVSAMVMNKILTSSMEQLWLAFVMSEKYNKIWNGKEWDLKFER